MKTSVLPSRRLAQGFTLLELLAAITIVGLLLAVSVPASVRFYDSIQYRQAVRDVITLLGSARYLAVNEGRAQDVVIDPRSNELSLNDKREYLPGSLKLAVHTARELNQRDRGVIRFYPEGGSSGGGIDIERPGVDGVRISVDWLVGRVSQERYALE
jgi:general secretion pathway protein H